MPRYSKTWYGAKRNKYGSGKMVIDGIVFDSRKEGCRYQQLMEQQKSGTIQNLQRQVKYVLIPTQREPDIIGARGGVTKGKLLEKECAYFADFVYQKDGETIVEDTKGMRTTDYIIKRKLMLYVHGIRISEI